jgi:hypothetical protein
MKQTRILILVIPLLLFVLACRAVMAPIDQAKNVGSTAEAAATQISDLATQAGGFATDISPFATALANPTGDAIMPNGIFDPKDPPLKEWKGVPIMPEAIAGNESVEMYSYTIKSELKAVEEFYASQLTSLGWSTVVNMPAQSGSSVLIYQKDGQTLSVTITTLEDHLLVLLTLQ